MWKLRDRGEELASKGERMTMEGGIPKLVHTLRAELLRWAPVGKWMIEFWMRSRIVSWDWDLGFGSDVIGDIRDLYNTTLRLQPVEEWVGYSRRLLTSLRCAIHRWLEWNQSAKNLTLSGSDFKRLGVKNEVCVFLFQKMTILVLEEEIRKPCWDDHEKIGLTVVCSILLEQRKFFVVCEGYLDRQRKG